MDAIQGLILLLCAEAANCEVSGIGKRNDANMHQSTIKLEDKCYRIESKPYSVAAKTYRFKWRTISCAGEIK